MADESALEYMTQNSGRAGIAQEIKPILSIHAVGVSEQL